MSQIPRTPPPYPVSYASKCLSCGYPLRDLPGRVCPECGREFDPDKPWTMQFPGAPHARSWRAMEPVRWSPRVLKRVAIGLLILSAWFPLPAPLPLIAMVVLMRVVQLVFRIRSDSRRRLIDYYQLDRSSEKVDDADVSSLRKTFMTAFVLMLAHVPFLVAFAVSYPFLARSANYWWTVAPVTQSPPDHWTIRGVFLVKIETSMRGVTFRLPVGHIKFERQNGGSGLRPDFVSGFE